MTSFFAWLDHSEHERRKMLDVIDLFREQDTRDELGIGTIRDAMGDLLFPGTSTIQTRARYFLFVPWIYKAIEDKRLVGSEAAQRARKDEVAVIEPLVESGETDGVIGIEARDKLKRLPSAVYWQGLGSWGIRLFPGSQDQYHNALARLYSARVNAQRDDDGEPVDGGGRAAWDPRLPAPPPDFPRGVTFALTKSEAEYLRERLTVRCQGTLLAWIVDDGRAWTSVSFAWEHPRAAAFPAQIQEQLRHARCFSETFHGAALLYNLMLAEAAADQKRIEGYRHQLQAWSGEVSAQAEAVAEWDEARFWIIVRSRGAQVGPLTQTFVSRWLALVRQARRPIDLADDQIARELLHKREQHVKGDQARLDNKRALERWGGAAGAGQLTYRWGKAQRIALDILSGLGATHA